MTFSISRPGRTSPGPTPRRRRNGHGCGPWASSRRRRPGCAAARQCRLDAPIDQMNLQGGGRPTNVNTQPEAMPPGDGSASARTSRRRRTDPGPPRPGRARPGGWRCSHRLQRATSHRRVIREASNRSGILDCLTVSGNSQRDEMARPNGMSSDQAGSRAGCEWLDGAKGAQPISSCCFAFDCFTPRRPGLPGR